MHDRAAGVESGTDAGITAADAGVVRVEVDGPNFITDKSAIFKGAL